MSDSAAVCPQHWLHADPREAATGSQELCAGSAPSTMLVCVICLDTDSKMSVLSELNLTEAYEKLIGDPLYDVGNLKQALCVQCAQTLRKFARFRDKSLRARSLMMELLGKRGSITTQHIKMLQCGHNQLKNNLVSTSLGPDHYDLLILEVDRQTDLEEVEHGVEIKNECNDDADSGSGDEVIKEDEVDAACVSEGFNEGLIKYESAAFMCRVCYEEFHSEHAYNANLSMHMHGDVQPSADSAHSMVTALSAGLATSTGNDEANSTPSSERALVSDGDASHTRALDSDSTVTSIRSCVVKLYDIFKCPPTADTKVEPSTRTLRDVSSCDSLNAHTACEDAQHRAASVGEVAVTRSEPAASTAPSETESCASGNTPRARAFTCDVCQRAFTIKGNLVTHMRCHTGEKPYSCELCSYKCANKSSLVYHMRRHTGEKPFSCELCSYKCVLSKDLLKHMRIHTGEKPFSCELCSYKCAMKNSLVCHMRTHTGEKPYSCKLCSYQCKMNSDLLKHMRIHTGEKPFSCKVCSYKCAIKNNLVCHMRTHTGEKPYSCKLCSYKCVYNKDLLTHMRIHTGEKPFSCKLCSYKCTVKNSLVCHMRTHTGEKPYSCKLCSYKCANKSSLVYHMRIHTGKKPYSCNMCSYKCKSNSDLLRHMRIHTGEKPFSCKLCSYKCAIKNSLVCHMRTHTGEKPYSCKLCSSKFVQNGDLIKHMRTHTGEKPYSCNMCSYKCAHKSSLVYHMRMHTGEKPHSCKLCSYKSVRNNNLLRHMRIHTSEKPAASTKFSYTHEMPHW